MQLILFSGWHFTKSYNLLPAHKNARCNYSHRAILFVISQSDIQSSTGTNYLPGYIAAHIACQKQSHIGHVFRGAKPAEGYASFVLISGFAVF